MVLENKTAIVFGANGYLGRHICYFLKERGIQFMPTGNSEKSIDNHSNYIQIDITIKEDLEQLNFNVDYVFAFAGLTGTENSESVIDSFTKVNEQGLSNLIECCEQTKDVRIIFPSTRLVYKGVENTPLEENGEKETKTIYAKNKLVCEQMLESSNVDFTIFRICVPYGNLFDSNYSYGTIGFFMTKASKGENITLYGNGGLKRTFTYVADLVNTILNSIDIDQTINDVYNIGGTDNLSLLDAASIIATKYKVGVEFVDWPEEAFKIESGDTIFSDKKIQNLINYNYQHSLEKWLKD